MNNNRLNKYNKKMYKYKIHLRLFKNILIIIN